MSDGESWGCAWLQAQPFDKTSELRFFFFLFFFALEFYLDWFLILNTLKRLFNTNMNEITELPLEVTLTTFPHHRSKMEKLGRSGLKPK